MVDVTKYIAEIHEKNGTKTARDFDLCAKYAKLSQWIVIGIPLSCHITGIVYQSPAFIAIFTKGIIRPSVHIYFPGANELHKIDMSVLLLFNVIFDMFAIAVVTASDAFIGINVSTVPMVSTIVQRQIGDLRNVLNPKQNINSELIKQQLIEIITMQLNYNE